MLEPSVDIQKNTGIGIFLEELKLLKRVAINPQTDTERLVAITTPPSLQVPLSVQLLSSFKL